VSIILITETITTGIITTITGVLITATTGACIITIAPVIPDPLTGRPAPIHLLPPRPAVAAVAHPVVAAE
jgi:hypothetical protein